MASRTTFGILFLTRNIITLNGQFPSNGCFNTEQSKFT